MLLTKRAHRHTSVLRNPVRTTAATRPRRRSPITNINMSLGQAKKARMAALEDDTFIEDDGHDGPISAFSQSLNKFKKSPKKKGWLLPWRSSPLLDSRFTCSPSRKTLR